MTYENIFGFCARATASPSMDGGTCAFYLLQPFLESTVKIVGLKHQPIWLDIFVSSIIVLSG